ncbi:MAG: hypothetical protein HY317_04310, partial [Acidobacteria bacterium]|nr:hypothetical protein [Acidobacteriota bacterium]
MRAHGPVGSALAILGVLLSAIALLDPQRPALQPLGPGIAVAGLLLRRRGGHGDAPTVLAVVLSAAFATGAAVGPEFGADSPSYYVYLRSAAFDRDLDFTNEWVHWDYRLRRLTPTGLRRNVQSVGPAVLWSPFFLAAHVYVLADGVLGGHRYAADGYSAPYRRSTALGTLTLVVLGAGLLFHALAARHGPGVALVAVVGASAASPILYYAFVMPTMAHGPAFAVAAAAVAALLAVRDVPSLRGWVLVGAALGALALARWQAVVFALLVGLVAAEGLVRRTVRPVFVAAAAAAALLAFAPQLLAWQALFGRALTMPQGGGFVDWSSPHFLDTLVAADHGLFSWTPVLLVALLGLVAALPRDPLLHGGAILVLLATAWVNGGVSTWTGGDAFGARRFDAVIPLLALGLAVAVERAAALARRRPLLVPAAGVGLLVLWNVGLLVSFREGLYPEAAPLDRVAGTQGRNLRRGLQTLAGTLGGARARALVYRALGGEYVYTHRVKDGVIDLGGEDAELLHGEWSPPRRKPGEPSFRWALHPAACVRLPLESPRELPVAVTLRAPLDAQPQRATVSLNGRDVGPLDVPVEWGEIRATFPAEAVLPGENDLCLRFTSALPSENEGVRLAAQVAR